MHTPSHHLTSHHTTSLTHCSARGDTGLQARRGLIGGLLLVFDEHALPLQLSPVFDLLKLVRCSLHENWGWMSRACQSIRAGRITNNQSLLTPLVIVSLPGEGVMVLVCL